MNNQTKRSIATAGLLLFTLSSASFNDGAIADYHPTTQKLDMQSLDLLKSAMHFDFSRGEYRIVETRPWLKKENQTKQLSDKELTQILIKVGFTGNSLEMAKAVVFLESTNRPYALNKSSNCYGLFQINMTGSLGTNRLEKYGLSKREDLFNPIINASIAYQMSNGGTNWSAWSTEKSAKRLVN